MTDRLIIASAVAAVAGIGSPAAATAGGGCTAGRLSGTFAAIPGTHAAGAVEYTLALTNTSGRACTLPVRPALQLHGAGGKQLPTHATPPPSAIPVTLQPLATATAAVRLSVDVPGPGDVQQPGRPCEPPAVRVVVAASGTSLAVPLAPPVSVCFRGAIRYHAFVPLETQAIPPALVALIHGVITLPVYEYRLAVRVDPRDPTWVEWSVGPAGPDYQVQGAIAFAHLTGGRWRDVSGPGSADVCAGVPPSVVYALGMSGC